CFSFGIGDGASTALIKDIAWAVGGCAEFITGQDRVQPKVPQSLKWALQLSVTGISLSWDLPPGIQAELLHWDPEVIFAGQRCLVYAQLRGQPQRSLYQPGCIDLRAGLHYKFSSVELHRCSTSGEDALSRREKLSCRCSTVCTGG
ncbi:unnamed protein product, partial [Lepidochelys kempii]